MRTVSIGTMIRSIGGMVGTHDLTDWENEFIRFAPRNLGLQAGEDVNYKKHFA
jgi:hypothetical protein